MIVEMITSASEAEIKSQNETRSPACLKLSFNELVSRGINGQFLYSENYQRFKVVTWKGFGRQWVSTLFRHNFEFFDKLHLHEKRDPKTGIITYDVVEGQQRIKSVLEFIEGIRDRITNKIIRADLRLEDDVKVFFEGHWINFGGMTYKEIEASSKTKSTNPNEIAKANLIERFLIGFKSRVFDVTTYYTQTQDQIAEIFRMINTKTALTAQELRNSLGGLCCEYVRVAARESALPREGIKFHQIFKQDKKNGIYMKISYEHMYYERIMAELCYFQQFYKNGTNPSYKLCTENVDKMYRINRDNSLKFVENVYNKVIEKLDILYTMANTKNGKKNMAFGSKGQLDVFFYILYSIEQRFADKKMVVVDAVKLYNRMMVLHGKFLTPIKDAITGKLVDCDYHYKVRKNHYSVEHIKLILEVYWKDFINQSIKSFKENGIEFKDLTVSSTVSSDSNTTTTREEAKTVIVSVQKEPEIDTSLIEEGSLVTVDGQEEEEEREDNDEEDDE